MSLKETFSAGQTREFYGEGDFFRLLETVAGINVEFFYQGREVAEMVDIQAGYAESFAREQKRFDRIRIYSATAQGVKWVIREGSDVRYDRGAASITGTVEIGATSLAALEQTNVRPEQYSPARPPVALAAGAVQLLAPGANTNGYLIQELQAMAVASAGGGGVFLAKAGAAPTSITDGDGLGMVGIHSFNTNNYLGGRVCNVMVPAGKGIYFYGSVGSVFTGSASYATLVGKAL